MSGQVAFDKPVRPAAMCRGETAEKENVERNEERDEMPDEEGDEIDGEEKLAAPDWQDPGTNRHKGRERRTKQHRCRSETDAHTA